MTPTGDVKSTRVERMQDSIDEMKRIAVEYAVEHGGELKSAAKSIGWRSRMGMYPIGVGGALWGAAAAMHEGGVNPLYVLGGAAGVGVGLAAVKKTRVWIGKKLWRKNWAVGGLAVATAWTTAAVNAGAGMDTPMPLLLVASGGLVAAPWCWVNRPKPPPPPFVPPVVVVPSPPPAEILAAEPLPAIEAPPPPHPDQAAWGEHVGATRQALEGTFLSDGVEICDHAGKPNGTAWIINGGFKKTTYPVMRGALDEIKATLDRRDVDNLIYIEPDAEGYKTRGRAIVLDRNPLVEEVMWDGPQLDQETGLVPMAIYPDGSGWAYYVLYRPRWGTPHDLLGGCTGSGKSTALRLIIGESICAGSSLMLFDPHGGGSFKEALPKVSRAFLDEAEIFAGARGLEAAQNERLEILREVGEDRMGPEFGHPIVHAVMDEASNKALLANKIVNGIILSGVQEGRKLWMKWTIAMQRPSVDAFDDNSDAREQLLSGNKIIYRVATAQTTRMVNQAGLDIEPHSIPKSFDADGKILTTGLGFVLGSTDRPLISRTMHASQTAFTEHVPGCEPLDDRTRRAFERGYEQGLEEIVRLNEETDDDEQPAKKKKAKKESAATPIDRNGERYMEQARELLYERGALTPADLVTEEVCQLAQAYRACEGLTGEGVAQREDNGTYVLRAS